MQDLFIFLCWIAVCVGDNSEWPTLSATRATALRTQRDVSKDLGVSQGVVMGARLSTLIWDIDGYQNETLSTIRSLLDVGMQTLVVDLYLNEKTLEWQFCPAPYPSDEDADVSNLHYSGTHYHCERGFTLDALLLVVKQFLRDTETNLSANLLYLIFVLHSLWPSVSYDYVASNASLSNAFDRTGFWGVYHSDNSTAYLPSLDYFLYTGNFRVVPILLDGELSSNSSYTPETDFFYVGGRNTDVAFEHYSDISCNEITTVGELTELLQTSFRFAYDDDEEKFSTSDVRTTQLCGYSTIISSRISPIEDIAVYLNNSFWSWAPSEPANITLSAARRLLNESEVLAPNANDKYADNCAVSVKEGWVATNCYAKYHPACRNVSNDMDWYIERSDKVTYFDATGLTQGNINKANNICSDGAEFACPRSALEQAALQRAVESMFGDEDVPVWIDMNSIATSSCWVTGGSTAVCPYQKTVSKSYFSQMITPTCVCAFVLVLAMIGLQFDRVPIQKNRYYWKRALSEYSKNEYEGVPS